LSAGRRLRVAGVGAGYFAQFHLEGWRGIDAVDYVGLCDADRGKAEALAARFGIREVFADAATMLDRLRPDLFDIVTPPATHRALVATGAARGVPMICQKPLAPSYAEALEIVESAERASTLLVVHENFRFQPWYREAKRLLEAGTLGVPHTIAFRLRPGDGQGPRAYLDRQPYFQQMPRLLVYETAIHFIDTYRYLLGEIRSVYAQLRRMNPVIAGEDAGYIVFDFASGATGLFDGNRSNDHVAANPRRTMGEMWLEGSAGVLRLDGDARLFWKAHHGEEREHVYDRGDDATFGGGACGALQRHVVAHLLESGPVENTGRDYLVNLRVQDAIYRSSEEERRLAIAP
jgi:D-apiose dehydrogenase